MKRFLLITFLLVNCAGRTFAQTGWINQTSGEPLILRSVMFIDSSIGTAVGDYGVIAHTTDAGVSWTRLNVGSDIFLTGVSFADSTYGIAVGQNGKILRTTDGGATWIASSIGNINLQSVQMLTRSNAVAVGSVGHVFRTTNGGNNWTSWQSPSRRRVQAVSFGDANTGYVVGEYGTILKTTTGGTTWISQNNPLPLHDFLGVSCIDSNTASVVGYAGAILRTSDGGANWIQQTSGLPLNMRLNAVSFADRNAGTAVGEQGIIVHTTDAGETWSRQGSGISWDLFAVWHSSAHTATAVGPYILRTDRGGIVPIQFEYFRGYGIGAGRVQLIWSTFNETNSHGFEVERNSTILPNSFVAGHGTTREPHIYGFVDSPVGPGSWSYRLKLIGTDSSVHYTDPIRVDIATSVIEELRKDFALHQNYPNPFNPSTVISYSVAHPSNVSLKVFDMLGREVVVLVSSIVEGGNHEARWDASGVGSGVYFCELNVAGFRQTKRMVLLK